MSKKYIGVSIEKSCIVGLRIWNFVDFRTPQNPGITILNRRGVFTRDRQLKLVVYVVKIFNKIPTYLE